MSEVNDFDLFIGLIFAKLYEARPRKLDLDPSDFALLEDKPEKTEHWESTMDWLRKESYIRCQQVADNLDGETAYFGVELTEKGYRALNSLPAVLRAKGDERGLGNQLVDAAKQVGMKSATKLAEKGVDEGTRRLVDLVHGLFS
ncbi:hypothetical protein [Microvirga lenta]|uniref:hypothetical protein n=1 Tax=Microvirga lenta TaxID=2881337 RepID=UPI001CFF8CC1|nr:hypothetical protein [Microvirga lenta]MCB5176791.1 hypothetical protein [Microvirga lenta]